jgi:hypothetical protein
MGDGDPGDHAGDKTSARLGGYTRGCTQASQTARCVGPAHGRIGTALATAPLFNPGKGRGPSALGRRMPRADIRRPGLTAPRPRVLASPARAGEKPADGCDTSGRGTAPAARRSFAVAAAARTSASRDKSWGISRTVTPAARPVTPTSVSVSPGLPTRSRSGAVGLWLACHLKGDGRAQPPGRARNHHRSGVSNCHPCAWTKPRSQALGRLDDRRLGRARTPSELLASSLVVDDRPWYIVSRRLLR